MLRCRARSWHETDSLTLAIIDLCYRSERPRFDHLRKGRWRPSQYYGPESSGPSLTLLWHHDQCRASWLRQQPLASLVPLCETSEPRLSDVIRG